MLPLYEAKMIHHYDHRWATFVDGDTVRDVTREEKGDPDFQPIPRYWVRESVVNEVLPRDGGSLLGVRDITNSTNERTVLASPFPYAGVGNNLPIILGAENPWALTGVLSSFVLDFVGRPKVGGVHLNFFIANQLAVLPPHELAKVSPWVGTRGEPLDVWLTSRVRALSAVSGWGVFPREAVRAEIDAAMFHAYAIERDDVDYIMETFPIVKRKDIAAHGEFRTKRLILETYDAMAEAIETGVPYESPFDELLSEGE
jgi:hypothetical protein